MAKKAAIYVCNTCGNEASVWSGKCSFCGEWNSLGEVRISSKSSKGKLKPSEVGEVLPVAEIEKAYSSEERKSSGIKGLDDVLGGGYVSGEVVLLTGEPGVGKSTLTLLTCLKMASNKSKVLYFSGEESETQVLNRVERVSKMIPRAKSYSKNLFIKYSNNIDEIAASVIKENPDFVVIDSIQSVGTDDVASVVGSVTQVKESITRISKVVKELKIPAIVIGQITKSGVIAGPKVLEHFVDCVLKFEGDRVSDLRILSSSKNRFGATDEIAVYKMTDQGVEEIRDASSLFISSGKGLTGIARSVIMYGQRPLLVEVQALINTTALGYPRRVAEGYSKNRLEILVAILQKRLGVRLSDKDIYINVLGGIKVKDPAIDLAICAAILSVHKETALKEGITLMGEVSLAGQVMGVVRMEQRVKEAVKVGSKIVIGGSRLPKQSKYSQVSNIKNLQKVIF